MSRTKYFSAELVSYRYAVTTVNLDTREFSDSILKSVGTELTTEQVITKASTDTIKAISAKLIETVKGIYRMTDECFYSHAMRSNKRPRDRHERYITRTVNVHTVTLESVNLDTREFGTIVVEFVGNRPVDSDIIADWNKSHSSNVALRVIEDVTLEYIYSMTEFEFMYYAEYVGESR